MTITPGPAPDRRADGRRRYDWSKIQLDQWQCWLDLTTQTLTEKEAHTAAERVRLAAYAHARKQRWHMESRRSAGGRVLDLRFTTT